MDDVIEIKAADSNVTRPQKGTWFLHYVDRWPMNGIYGGYYIYHDGVHYEIAQDEKTHKQVADIATGRITLKTGHIMDVGDSKSSWDLFYGVVAIPWDIIYEARYSLDEDYVDYAPMFIKDVDGLVNGRGVTYGLRPYSERHAATR